jgi:hypothetical protein
MLADSYTLYVLEFNNGIADIVLKHPREIHDRLVEIVEKVLDEKRQQTDIKMFKKTTYFSKGYVNSSQIISSKELYTNMIYLTLMTADAVGKIDSEIKIKYLPEAERFRLLHPNLFDEDYSDFNAL